ncbi:MAG: hypothetical protein RLZZ123_1481 [Pseudomonadota bacterium]
MPVIIIASGAVIAREFQAEIGRIPPAFLPLGHKRLYEHQAHHLRQAFPDEQIFMSIPESFRVPPHDIELLAGLGVQQVQVPEELPLGASILSIINRIGIYDGPLRQLHGDTLIDLFPNEADVIGLGHTEDDYPWEIEDRSAQDATAWCGYFSFSNIKLLAQSLALSQGNYVDAIRHYRTVQPQSARLIEGWKDMGHINTYYRARAEFTTERAFNQLRIEDGVVRKTGTDGRKIEAESRWFSTLPPRLKKHTPQLIHCSTQGSQPHYDIEYVPHLSLAELYVFGNLPVAFWAKIFQRVNQVLGDFAQATPEVRLNARLIEQDFEQLIVHKTMARLKDHLGSQGQTFDTPHELNGQSLPSLNDILRVCQAAIASQAPMPSVIHGDFCFSNILYDSRLDRLKLIDPRGLNGQSEPSIEGDLRYDIAKFTHSAVGLYDHIVSGHYELRELGTHRFFLKIDADLQTQTAVKHFLSSTLHGQRVFDALPLVVLLFFSMLPLHSESPKRQRALYANALRIFQLWREV